METVKDDNARKDGNIVLKVLTFLFRRGGKIWIEANDNGIKR